MDVKPDPNAQRHYHKAVVYNARQYGKSKGKVKTCLPILSKSELVENY